MSRRIKGAEIELEMVKNLFKKGGIGFRAPASGTYVLPKKPIPYTGLQKKCVIPIEGIDFIDFGFNPSGYQTSDYAGFFPTPSVTRVASHGIFGGNEFRFVEAKTIRLRKSHLTKQERSLGKNGIDVKKHTMKTTFNLLQKETRMYITEKRNGKNVSVKNPYYGMLRKSDFCMELQRTWYMELLMRKNIREMLASIGINIENVRLPVYAYLQVRFIGANAELWVRISDLATYNDWTRKEKRDPSATMLDIIKTEKNEIFWRWRRNKAISKKI